MRIYACLYTLGMDARMHTHAHTQTIHPPIIHVEIKVVKVKFSLEQATKVRRRVEV